MPQKSSSKENPIAAAVLGRVNKSPTSNTNKTLATKTNKTLSSKTKSFILKRDGCCQYVDKKSGRQCESTFGLEVDHIIPKFAGGNHDLNNLQALCKKHNVYRYHRQAQIRFL